MRLSGRSARLVRICGGIWIVLAPILWLMAAISSLESDVAYRVQLVAFSAAAIVGLVSGVCALLAHTWAARGLFLVSSLGVAYFFGTAAYALVLPFVPWSTLKEPGLKSLPIALLLATMSAPLGIPFLLMAVTIRRALATHCMTGMCLVPSDSLNGRVDR